VLTGRKWQREPGVLKRDIRRAALEEALTHDDVAVVTMSTSGRDSRDYATCWFDTQRDAWRVSLFASGYRPEGVPSTRERWISAVIAFADQAAAPMGVMYVTSNTQDATRESDILASSGPGAESHPMCAQWTRMSAHRDHIGERYVRFPRWGTLYSHVHVAELGGTAAIVAAIQPAIVRELSGGVYFQLTDSTDTALSDESLAKQRAFAEIAEPLLPPPI
jgi:hypothetical protein